MFDFFGDIGSFIMTPLYSLTSFVLLGLPLALRRRSSARTTGVGLGAVDRRPDPGDPGRADPAVRQADQVQPQHAAAAAQGQGAAEEVRPRPGASRPGDDGALQGDGTNPFASCLPILLQMPIFLALFRLIDQAAKNGDERTGVLTAEQADQLRRREALRRQISDTLHRPTDSVERADPGRRAGGGDDGDHVPHPAPADEQEHAGRRA